MGPPSVPDIARRQAGVFTPSQALTAGFTARQVRRRRETGAWPCVVGTGLVARCTIIGPRQVGYAVTLSVPGAVLSHELAGALWGFPVQPRAVACVEPGRHVEPRGITLLQRMVLPEARGRCGDLVLTDERRTAVDLLAILDWDRARNLFAYVSSRGILTPGQLNDALPTRHRMPGTKQLRRLARWTAAGSMSAAEDRLHTLLRAAGLSGWSAGTAIVVDGRVVALADVLFAAERVVVEVDGWDAHSSREAFQRDRARQNALTAAGYLVIRFTWADLRDRPQQVISTIRRTLEGRRTR